MNSSPLDFTIEIYSQLLNAINGQGYQFQTFREFLLTPHERAVVLRHDVDLLPGNSLRFAKIQYDLGISGVYYFRAVKESWDEKIIKEIQSMGHEIGLHYETMDMAKGDIDLAWDMFLEQLKKLRKISKVSTICMHGSPLSKFDNRQLWEEYSYYDLDLIGEPYFDIDFKKVMYLTDTGRKWDGEKVSVRDKVDSGYDISFRNTMEIINSFDKSQMPDQIMFNFHPQRWHSDKFLWLKELVMQNSKNIIKRMIFVK